MLQKICDTHIHTKYSCDSVTELEDYCLKAIEDGIGIICFTDHLDCNPHDIGYEYYDAKSFFDDFYKVKEKYGKKLTVLSGIEFGDPHMYQSTLQEYSAMDYDYILATLHFWYEDMYPDHMLEVGVSTDTCYEYYWDEVLKAVQAGGFDCLGHLDFPKRYYKEMVFDSNMISEIFREMISKNISLEINTSTLRQNMKETMPDKELLRIYKDFGGKYITLGSDAHRSDDLAAGNIYARKLIEYFNFEQVYFSERKMCSL